MVLWEVSRAQRQAGGEVALDDAKLRVGRNRQAESKEVTSHATGSSGSCAKVGGGDKMLVL